MSLFLISYTHFALYICNDSGLAYAHFALFNDSQIRIVLVVLVLLFLFGNQKSAIDIIHTAKSLFPLQFILFRILLPLYRASDVRESRSLAQGVPYIRSAL